MLSKGKRGGSPFSLVLQTGHNRTSGSRREGEREEENKGRLNSRAEQVGRVYVFTCLS